MSLILNDVKKNQNKWRFMEFILEDTVISYKKKNPRNLRKVTEDIIPSVKKKLIRKTII